MTTTVKLSALDTLFFRDGKPFSMGDETWADGIFPPPPSVIYGALRTVFFSDDIKKFSALKSEGKDETLKLKIHSIYFHHDEANFFPVPLDIVENKNNQEDVKFLQLEDSFLKSNQDEGTKLLISPSDGQYKSIDIGFLESRQFISYLKGDVPTVYRHNFICREPKVGIGRNNQTNTSENGMLYRVGMNRLADHQNKRVDIIVEFSELEVGSHLMRLGSEGKTVELSAHEIPFKVPEAGEIFEGYDSKRFKIYLSTPSYFSQGWKPKLPIDLKILAAAIGKPLYIGGFDMQKGYPKPLRRFVPAGSVLIVEIQNDKTIFDFISDFHGVSISENEETKLQGFGIAFMGRVQ